MVQNTDFKGAVKVKIIQCSDTNRWYRDNIENEFYVFPDAEIFNSGRHNFYPVFDMKGFYLEESDIEFIKQETKMKADDKVTLEFTGRELAAVYALVGQSSGTGLLDLFDKAKELLDDRDQKLFDSTKPIEETIRYHEKQKEWEEALFPELGKSVEEKQLDEVLSKIKELQEQAEILKEMLDK